MSDPELTAGIEELHGSSCSRVSTRSTRFLPKRARDAGECKIAGRGWSSGGPRKDVVDVERCFLTFLGQSAILAPVGGAEHDELSQSGRDRVHDRFGATA